MSAVWSLTGGKRTLPVHGQTDEIDPGRTSSNQREELKPRSVRNSLRRLGQAVGKELSHARPVMLGKYLGHQFAPTTDPDLVKDRLHIL